MGAGWSLGPTRGGFPEAPPARMLPRRRWRRGLARQEDGSPRWTRSSNCCRRCRCWPGSIATASRRSGGSPMRSTCPPAASSLGRVRRVTSSSSSSMARSASIGTASTCASRARRLLRRAGAPRQGAPDRDRDLHDRVPPAGHRPPGVPHVARGFPEDPERRPRGGGPAHPAPGGRIEGLAGPLAQAFPGVDGRRAPERRGDALSRRPSG